MIKAEIVADSINEKGNRITSFIVTFPRIILAEKNTHRVFSRNSASSRAIPFPKMVKSVRENPFIPIAWQKDHKGMQGTEYFSKEEKFEISIFIQALDKIFKGDEELIKLFTDIFEGWKGVEKTLDEWWLVARDYALESSILLSCFGVTKQLCNRLLEPFMWHTILVTSTEWENFFALRCPKYSIIDRVENNNPIYRYVRSKKDYIKDHINNEGTIGQVSFPLDSWLRLNQGQAEIHMMALAEAIYDSYNESKPELLKEGEYHIPFKDRIQLNNLGFLVTEQEIETALKISTVMGARTSYTVVGEDQKPMTYKRMCELHDEMLEAKPVHASPFEHCALNMNNNEKSRNFIGGWKQYRDLLNI